MVLRGSQRVPSQATSLIRTHSNRTYKILCLQPTCKQPVGSSWNGAFLLEPKTKTHCAQHKSGHTVLGKRPTTTTHSWMLFSSPQLFRRRLTFFSLSWHGWSHYNVPVFDVIGWHLQWWVVHQQAESWNKSAWNHHSQHLTTGPS